MTIRQEIQKPAPDSIVELFELDCTALGGSIFRFSPHVSERYTSVTFNNKTWQAMPITCTGFSYSTSEAPAKPTIAVSNISKVLLASVIGLGDIVGAKLTRYRTFRRYLGDGAEPNGAAFLPVDIFYVERKVAHNKFSITWQLTSELDKINQKLPKRLFLKRDFPGLAASRFRV